MPHIDIKSFPHDLNADETQALAADITEVIIRHLKSKNRSVSVAWTQVPPEEWKAVWDSQIGPYLDELIKKPGYSM